MVPWSIKEHCSPAWFLLQCSSLESKTHCLQLHLLRNTMGVLICYPLWTLIEVYKGHIWYKAAWRSKLPAAVGFILPLYYRSGDLSCKQTDHNGKGKMNRCTAYGLQAFHQKHDILIISLWHTCWWVHCILLCCCSHFDCNMNILGKHIWPH